MTALISVVVDDGVIFAADTRRTHAVTGEFTETVKKIFTLGQHRAMIEGLTAVTEGAIRALKAQVDVASDLEEKVAFIQAEGPKLFKTYAARDPEAVASVQRAAVTIGGLNQNGEPRSFYIPVHDGENMREDTPCSIGAAPPKEYSTLRGEVEKEVLDTQVQTRFSMTALLFEMMRRGEEKVPSKIGLPVDISFVGTGGRFSDFRLNSPPSIVEPALTCCWSATGSLRTCFR